MSNELIKIDYESKEMLETMRQTVAQKATDPELAMFVQFCKSSGLNPFKREAWFIKPDPYRNQKGIMVQPPVQMCASANGMHTTANRHPAYDGFESGFVAANGDLLALEYPKDDYIGAWALVYRKDRSRPSKAVAMMSEYNKGQSNWNKMPRVMIVKCAEAAALRKAFPIELGDLYIPEEMHDSTPVQPVSQDNLARGTDEVKAEIKQIEHQEVKESAGFTYDFSQLTKDVADKQKRAGMWKDAQALGAVGEKDATGKALVYSPVVIPGWDKWALNPEQEELFDDDIPGFELDGLEEEEAA